MPSTRATATRRPSRRWASALTAAAGVTACSDVAGSMEHQGGGWYTTFTSSFPESGGNIRLYRHDGAGAPVLVDERAHVIRFYSPDCILYSPGREAGVTYAACGNRRPVPVAAFAPWLLRGGYQADSSGLRRVDTVRVFDGRGVATVIRLPIAQTRTVAESQPALEAGWQRAADTMSLAIEPLITDEPVDVTARTQDGRTALMEAVLDRQRDVVDALLRQGADVNAADYGDSTPLFLAIDIFDTDTVIVARLLTPARTSTQRTMSELRR